MSDRSTQHTTFVIERTYAASPKRVFAAMADPVAKARWFGGSEAWEKDDAGFTSTGRYQLDFRVGGREHSSGGPPGGPVYTFDALYQDIVPDQRIVYTYDMHLDDKRISVSLATVELRPAGAGTKLTFTEQAVFLDGLDKPADRERGTRELLEALNGELQRESATA